MKPRARMARDAGTLLVSRLAEGAIAFFFSAWTVRLVTKEELSLWPVLGLLAGITQSVAGFGLPMAGVRLIPAHLAKGEREEAGRILRTSLVMHCLALLLLSSALVAGSRFVARLMLKDEHMAGAVTMLAPGMFFSALAMQISFYLQATGGFTQIGINLIVRGLATTVLAPWLYLWLGVPGIAIALALGPFLSCALGVISMRGLLLGTRTFAPAGKLVRFSLSYWGTSIITFAHSNADFLLLSLLTSPKQLAPYYVAYRFISYLLQLSNATLTVAGKRVAELQVERQERVEAAFTAMSRYLFLGLLPIYVWVAALSWPLIATYAGGKYPQAAPTLALLCIYVFMVTVFGMYRLNIWVRGKPVETLRLQVVSAVLMVALTAVGVVAWGGLGAAVGQAAALVVGSLVGRRWLQRLIRVRYDMFALRMTVAGAAGMLAVVVIPQFLTRHPAAVAAYALCGAVVYVCLAAPAIREEDSDMIQGIVPGRMVGPLMRALRRLGACRPRIGGNAEEQQVSTGTSEGALDGSARP